MMVATGCPLWDQVRVFPVQDTASSCSSAKDPWQDTAEPICGAKNLFAKRAKIATRRRDGKTRSKKLEGISG